MIKNKKNLIFIFFVVLICFSLLLVGSISAKQEKNQGDSSQVRNQNQNSTSTVDDDDDDNATTSDDDNATSTNKGRATSAEHRSVVATFVHSLLEVADREGGIGQQVRVVARAQNQSASTTLQAMEKIETRSKFKSLLIGTDYKNLGTLRSEMVQTQSRIEQLTRLAERTQNEADKTELQNQIQILEQEQTKINNFIKSQEGKFSLFGWLFRFFNK